MIQGVIASRLPPAPPGTSGTRRPPVPQRLHGDPSLSRQIVCPGARHAEPPDSKRVPKTFGPFFCYRRAQRGDLALPSPSHPDVVVVEGCGTAEGQFQLTLACDTVQPTGTTTAAGDTGDTGGTTPNSAPTACPDYRAPHVRGHCQLQGAGFDLVDDGHHD